MTLTHEMHRKNRIAWFLGLLLSSVMMLSVFLFFSMRYWTVDDTMILRQMMGFGVQELPDFNMCVTCVVLYPLRWLATLFPNLPWFSYLQLFCLWLAGAVASKSILQCYAQASRPLWQGIIAAIVFLLVFMLRYVSQVTFTVTAALLGAAAVLQLMSIDAEHTSNSQWFLAALLALLMAVLGYGMRETTVLPTLAFCGIAVIVQGLRRAKAGQNWLKPLALTAAVVLVVLGALAGYRSWEIANKPGIQQYMDWQDARSRIWDFLGIENIPQETREEYNISETRLALLGEWYLMDGDMNTETLIAIGDAIEANMDHRLSTRLQKALEQIQKLPAQDPIAAPSLWLPGAMYLSCILLLLLGSKKQKQPQWTGLLLTAPAAILMILFLAVQGRLPMRVMLCVVLPMAALLSGLAPFCYSRGSKGQQFLPILACLLIVSLSVWYTIPMVQANWRDEMTDDEIMAETTYAAIDDYAVCNEECLMILDGTLIGDTRMFPTTEYGISKNVHFWGGWNIHHPSYDAMLEAYGFDPYNWSLDNFFSDDVRLLRGGVEPPSLLMDALNEICETECYLDSEWDGVYSMYFEEW